MKVPTPSSDHLDKLLRSTLSADWSWRMVSGKLVITDDVGVAALDSADVDVIEAFAQGFYRGRNTERSK